MASPIDTLISVITQEAAKSLPIHPNDLVGIGIKNIHYYRMKISKLINASTLSGEDKVALF